MSTTIEMQAKAAETQGQIRNFQAKLFTIGIREEALAKERQAAERELAGAIGQLNAYTEARQIALAVENRATEELVARQREAKQRVAAKQAARQAAKQAAARTQGGPVAGE